MLRNFLKVSPEQDAADKLYRVVVAQSRQPGFYLSGGVPDSVDGRFELIALHTFLVLDRLKQDHPRGSALGQALHDIFFADMDHSLREMGAGDLGVGKRVKKMAQGFYGRVSAYETGLTGDGPSLEAALRRNLYGTLDQVDPAVLSAMSVYLEAQRSRLRGVSIEDILAGKLEFLPGDFR